MKNAPKVFALVALVVASAIGGHALNVMYIRWAVGPGPVSSQLVLPEECPADKLIFQTMDGSSRIIFLIPKGVECAIVDRGNP